MTAQLAYSNVSDRWFFPEMYYTFTEQVDASTTAQFVITVNPNPSTSLAPPGWPPLILAASRAGQVMIDTVTLAGASEDADGNDLPGSAYPGPADAQAAATQMEWLAATLAASTADYIFVSGHFPVAPQAGTCPAADPPRDPLRSQVWSVCEHGPTTKMVNDVMPLLDAHKVTAYFAGHDHCEEHMRPARFERTLPTHARRASACPALVDLSRTGRLSVRPSPWQRVQRDQLPRGRRREPERREPQAQGRGPRRRRQVPRHRPLPALRADRRLRVRRHRRRRRHRDALPQLERRRLQEDVHRAGDPPSFGLNITSGHPEAADGDVPRRRTRQAGRDRR